MKKPKNKKRIKKTIKILKEKKGSVKDFFASAREVMRAADRGEPIKKRKATLTFVDPSESL